MQWPQEHQVVNAERIVFSEYPNLVVAFKVRLNLVKRTEISLFYVEELLPAVYSFSLLHSFLDPLVELHKLGRRHIDFFNFAVL